jgi:hypothetical protein
VGAVLAVMGIPEHQHPAAHEHTRTCLLIYAISCRQPFEFHDLLRAYASERAGTQEGQESSAALRRVLDHYLHTTQAADQLINPARDAVVGDQPGPGVTPEQFQNEQAARARR